MNEFQIIKQFFQREPTDLLSAEKSPLGVVLGIGDDCALLQIPVTKQLAISVDTLVADVHFPADANAEDIGERALRVNLSDLAAMGAEPLWFTLALTLPKNSEFCSEDWLRLFSRGLFRVAKEFNIALVGGDTTSGPLSITIQAMGAVASHEALRRDGASIGDFICVTHFMGDGAAALAVIQNKLQIDDEHKKYLYNRFYRPTPRLKEAELLRGIASAALDVSDGLVADLAHICAASDLGALIDVENIPLSPALVAINNLDQAYCWALSGGDDYELCFTVSPEKMPELAMLIAQGKVHATVIGEMVAGANVLCELKGEPFSLDQQGYRHF
ncbi:MAG: thiamine-phosphate kinase [Pseudomonadota bacterium]